MRGWGWGWGWGWGCGWAQPQPQPQPLKKAVFIKMKKNIIYFYQLK